MGIIQEKLAEYISVTVGYISQIERGITKVNLDTLSKIAEILHCDFTDFICNTAKNTPNYLSNDLNEIFYRLSPINKKLLLEISEVFLNNQK